MIRTLCIVFVIVGLLVGTLAVVTPPVEEPDSTEITCSEPWTNRPDPKAERSEPQLDPPEPAWHPSALRRASSELPHGVSLLDELARLRFSSDQPIRFGAGGPVTGLMLEPVDAGKSRTVTITPWPEERGSDPVLSFQVVAGTRPTFVGRFVVAPFPELGIPPGEYAVRVDGRPCVVPDFPEDAKSLLFPQESAGTAPLSVFERSSGCENSSIRGRRFRPVGDEYVADDGACLSRAQVEDLRRRVLASSPRSGESLGEFLARPDAYLASLGITDEEIESHLATIRAACLDPRWKDANGNAPELPAGVDELLDLHALKTRLVDHLLHPPRMSTEDWSLTIEIPGEPWIQLGTESFGPDAVPWHVIAGRNCWDTVDRELSRALVELAPTGGSARYRVEKLRNWRDTVWAQPDAWGTLAAELNDAASHRSLELVPGWAGWRGRVQVGKVDTQPRARGTLPPMELSVKNPGTFDTIEFRPGGNEHWDWTDLRREFDRAERAAAAQPWLARWKQENHGQIAVLLPMWSDSMSTDRAAITVRLWKQAGIERTPEFALTFAYRVSVQWRDVEVEAGRAALSGAGDLLILESNTPDGPLAGRGLSRSCLEADGNYLVVRPGSAPEIRAR
jgi:hypothetical protein